MKKILFVCMGNICRSPAAEGVMKSLLNKNGIKDKVYVDSAGTIDYHTGEFPDPRMIEVASERGYELNHRARQITKSDLENFDYIITMDDQIYKSVNRLDSQKQYQHKIFKMTDFLSEMEADEIPDPYYGNKEDFEYSLDLIEDATKGLLNRIQNEM
ncbi:MAG: low molecular weight phosphotyrosine protein phosphatase [Ignavibacterium album]|uniref:low molecular weight protein-tyrosine-phosphatase n=1 Tax=Ignavibacterium album TaxID=591197 RepID=UPI0026F153E9|nr:low molecular weight protein-tyrosine-phosphatase [Ignavibacterium album]MBI5663087.1 low molecular weight phosphotyrosine protein phosphatase [Ignavibacterium album]